jgi:hypothetical protein
MTSCVKLWILAHRTGKGGSQLSGRGGSTNPQRARLVPVWVPLRPSVWLVARMTGKNGCPCHATVPAGQPLEKIREAVSDRGRGVRSRGEGPPTRGARSHRR